MKDERPSRADLTRHIGLFLALLLVDAAAAESVPGGGNKRSDCYIGLRVQSRRTIDVSRSGRRVVQESCGDRCVFDVSLCLNEPSDECRPAEIAGTDVSVTGPAILDRPLSDGCGRLGELEVRLGKGRRRNRERLVLVARAPHNRPRRDRDVVTFVCKESSAPCCGNQVVDSDETCDPPNGTDCDSACKRPKCGNGGHSAWEECDDGNLTNGTLTGDDRCDNNCTVTRCGNSIVTDGEECDPPSPSSPQCGANEVCTTGCKCESIQPCECGTPDVNQLAFTTTSTARPECGAVGDGTNELLSLDCGSLYIGGGKANAPVKLPAGVQLVANAFCSGSTMNLTGTAPSGDQDRTCTTSECFFGPPLPVIHNTVDSASLCVVNRVTPSRTLSGTMDCTNRHTDIRLPLFTSIYLTGDLLNGTAENQPNMEGVQPCPLCLDEQCVGGPNHGHRCSRGTSSEGDAYPTSVDCLPPQAKVLGTPMRFELALTTGTASKGAATLSGQPGVFAGFCRDINGKGRLCFEGDPGCGGDGSAKACASATDCTNPDFPDCQQGDSGAFNAPRARTIDLEGAKPEHALSDGQSAPVTLVGVFAVPPTFDSMVDQLAGLPGPAAISLPGLMQLRATSSAPRHAR